MANAQVLRNAVTEIQSTLGSDLTITAISNASEAVITATNTLTAGDLVVISGVVGMPKINDRVVRVKSPSGTQFTAEGVNSTNWGTYSSGGVANEVTAFQTFDNISQLDLPDAGPDEIDVTAISDDERKIVFGHDSAQKGTLSLIADPLSAAVVEAAAAATDAKRRVFRVTLQSGYVAIFNAFVSGGTGFSGGVGAAGTASISLTLRNKPQWFAS
jgi:hypothetical protein